MYKSYIKKLLLFFFLIIFTVFVFVVIAIDPLNENGYITHKFNQHKTGSSYSSSVLLFNKLKKDKYILVFGTSRSHKLSEKTLGQPTLNFSGSIYGQPNKVFNFLKQLNQKQKNNIIKIYYLLDFHTFSEDESKLLNYNSSYDFLKSQFTNFNIVKIETALKTIIANLKGAKDYVDENGCKVTLNEHTFNPKTSYGEINGFVKHQNNMIFKDSQFNYLAKINEFSKMNHIKTIYFIPTFNIVALKQFNFKILNYQKEKFSNILDNYFDLSYIPIISNNYNMFSDFSHPKHKGLEYIFNKINFSDYNITKNNVKEHIKDLQQRVNSYHKN